LSISGCVALQKPWQSHSQVVRIWLAADGE